MHLELFRRSMDTVDGAAESLREAITTFDIYLARRIIAEFPALSPLLRHIRDLAGSVDLDHLKFVPVQSLTTFKKLVDEATACIRDFILPSFPQENQVGTDGVVRPHKLVQNSANTNSWRGQLENAHRELFEILGPIVAQQQARLSRISAAIPMPVDATRSEHLLDSNSYIWRYMPLRNLLRCETASGIWMSSVELLRAWSVRGIPDTREGEIPIAIATLKDDFDQAYKGGKKSIREFAEKHELNEDKFDELRQALANLTLESTTTFVSSWCHKKNERANMWTSYGDGGKGVAIKVKLDNLKNSAWKVPMELSGKIGPNRLSSLILRKVRYFADDDVAKPPVLDDLHLPFLKRDQFEDEHEVRLVGFTSRPIPSQGFTLICNLAEIIEEIIVGPQGDLDGTIAEIKRSGADLAAVPISRSRI